jgi:hypothetical protein
VESVSFMLLAVILAACLASICDILSSDSSFIINNCCRRMHRLRILLQSVRAILLLPEAD